MNIEDFVDLGLPKAIYKKALKDTQSEDLDELMESANALQSRLSDLYHEEEDVQREYFQRFIEGDAPILKEIAVQKLFLMELETTDLYRMLLSGNLDLETNSKVIALLIQKNPSVKLGKSILGALFRTT